MLLSAVHAARARASQYEPPAGFLSMLKAADERLKIPAHGHGVGQVRDLTIELRHFRIDCRAWVRLVRPEEFAHGGDHLVGQVRRQDLADAIHDRLVNRLDPKPTRL